MCCVSVLVSYVCAEVRTGAAKADACRVGGGGSKEHTEERGEGERIEEGGLLREVEHGWRDGMHTDAGTRMQALLRARHCLG